MSRRPFSSFQARRRLSALAHHVCSATSSSAAKQRIRTQATAGLREEVDPDGLLEYSVVYTDRSLNHMSKKFQQVMRDISGMLKQIFNAQAVAIIPGSGTTAMEAVARQLGAGQTCMVIRNGFFSFRWTPILEQCSVAAKEIVLKAGPAEEGPNPAYAPPPIELVLETIQRERPGVVFAPHLETSSGIILPDDYIKSVADAVHAVGGLLVLDCIASGCCWVDMAKLQIDVVVSAPQKGYSASPCAGLVIMNDAAREAVANSSTSTSFTLDLKKWIAVMDAYEIGKHMYHATMPTDSILKFRDVLAESDQYGFARLKTEQLELGKSVRTLLSGRGLKSVAADGFGAPGVVVSYTEDEDVKSGAKFMANGMQVAAGVPLMCDEFTEGPEFKTFRLGLFGLDKLQHIPRTVRLLEEALDAIGNQGFEEQGGFKMPPDDSGKLTPAPWLRSRTTSTWLKTKTPTVQPQSVSVAGSSNEQK